MKFVASMWVVSFLGACAWVTAAGCGDEQDVFGEASSGGAGQGGSGNGTAQGTGAESTGASPSSSSGQGGDPAGSTGTPSGGEGPGPVGSGGSGGKPPEPVCGDFVCDQSECGTCPPDCGITCVDGCGNGTCDDGEDCSSCPADCQLGCGDGCCLLGEDCASCPGDCATPENCNPSACGNGQCNYGAGETCLNCADCFGLCDCGDHVCAAPETEENCPWDCGG